MILDRFDRVDLYFKPGSAMHKAVCFARDAAAALPDGVHLIDEKRLKANVESYETRPADERRFEAHRCYGDVQVMLEGEERQDFASGGMVESAIDYNPEKDVEFFKTPPAFTSVHLQPGWFVVYQPQELHRPGAAAEGGPCRIRKVCMKVLMVS